MKKIILIATALLMGTSGISQTQQACWVYPYYEEFCAPASVTKSLTVQCVVNKPSTGYHTYWRTRSVLSTGGYSYTAPIILVGTSTANYLLTQTHSYSMSVSGTYTATAYAEWSDDYVNWNTAFSFGGGGTPYTPCAYPLEINAKKNNNNFSFFVNGKKQESNGGAPVEVVLCNGEELKIDGITALGTYTHIDATIESDLEVRPIGLWALNSGMIDVTSLVPSGSISLGTSSVFYPYVFVAPIRYVKITVRVYGPCDPPPGYTEKTMIVKVIDATALVDFTLKEPSGAPCSTSMPRNESGVFASFAQPVVGTPPCESGWLGATLCGISGFSGSIFSGTIASSYTVMVEDITTSTVLGTHSASGGLPASSGFNAVTSGYFITNYNSIKNNNLFKVTATVNTTDCGPVSAFSYFKIIDGGSAGQWWKQTGIDETVIVEKLNVFPNPTSGKLNLFWKSENASNGATITLTDVLGKIVYNKQLQENKGVNDVSISIDDVAAGVYFYNLKTSGQEYSGKLMKQ